LLHIRCHFLTIDPSAPSLIDPNQEMANLARNQLPRGAAVYHPILSDPVDSPARRRLEQLLAAIESQFDSMAWIKSYTRKNVTDDTSCLSMHFGTVLRPYHGRQPASTNQRYPQLLQLLQQLSHYLAFPCTTYTINKNLLCKPHVDRHNLGDSLIIALGDFTGGHFDVEGQPFDVHHQPLLFNGALSVHATAPFQGTRYSIVLYNLD